MPFVPLWNIKPASHVPLTVPSGTRLINPAKSRARRVLAVSGPGNGLCNRLKAIYSALRIARRSGLEFGIIWHPNPSVPCNLQDLFELSPDLPRQVHPGDITYGSWRLWVDRHEIPANWTRAYPSADVGGRAIDFEFHRIPQQIRNEYLAVIPSIRPQPQLRERVDALAGQQFVAVHIRDGADWETYGRLVPLQKFLLAMREYPSDTKFYLSAHTRSTVQSVAEAFPGRVIHQIGKTYDGPTKERMQDALVDLLCLARGSSLIGTFASTFTECCWWLGGCRQKVTMVSGDQSKFRWF